MGTCKRLNPFAEVAQCWRGFLLTDSNLTLCQCRPMGGFHLSRHAGIPLFCGLLNVSAIEDEVIPVNSASLENCHFRPPPRLRPKKNFYPLGYILKFRTDWDDQNVC